MWLFQLEIYSKQTHVLLMLSCCSFMMFLILKNCYRLSILTGCHTRIIGTSCQVLSYSNTYTILLSCYSKGLWISEVYLVKSIKMTQLMLKSLSNCYAERSWMSKICMVKAVMRFSETVLQSNYPLLLVGSNVLEDVIPQVFT